MLTRLPFRALRHRADGSGPAVSYCEAVIRDMPGAPLAVSAIELPGRHRPKHRRVESLIPVCPYAGPRLFGLIAAAILRELRSGIPAPSAPADAERAGVGA